MLTPRGTDAWTAQVGITWPSAPWAHGKIDARIAETTAEVSAAEARLQATEQALRLTIQQAYIRVTTAEQRAALLQTTIVPQSRQTLEVSRVGYASDRIDFLTLLENQRTLLAEQLDYFRVLADLAEARADLERRRRHRPRIDIDGGRPPPPKARGKRDVTRQSSSCRLERGHCRRGDRRHARIPCPPHAAARGFPIVRRPTRQLPTRPACRRRRRDASR